MTCGFSLEYTVRNVPFQLVLWSLTSGAFSLSGLGTSCCHLVLKACLWHQCAIVGNKVSPVLHLSQLRGLGMAASDWARSSLYRFLFIIGVQRSIHEHVPFDTLHCKGSEILPSFLAQPVLMALYRSMWFCQNPRKVSREPSRMFR